MNKTEPIESALVNYCPFCDHFKSHDPSRFNPVLANNGKKRGFLAWVQCGLCNAAGPTSYDTKRAIELWNERGMESERIGACRLFAEALEGIVAVSKPYKDIPTGDRPVDLSELLARNLDD